MDKQRIGGFTAGLAVTMAVLAGCAGSAAPAASPSDPATPEASPSETTPPAAEDPADPHTWVIDVDRVGPIDIGGDFAATLAGLGGGWTNDPSACAWMASWTDAENGSGVFFVRGTESDSAPIREISVYSTAEQPSAIPGPATAEGIGVGATRADVLAAYADAQEGTASIGEGTWLMVPGDSEAHIFFEFRPGGDTVWDVTVTTGEEPSYEVCG